MATFEHGVIIKFAPRTDEEARQIISKVEGLAKQHNFQLIEARIYVEESGLATRFIEEEGPD